MRAALRDSEQSDLLTHNGVRQRDNGKRPMPLTFTKSNCCCIFLIRPETVTQSDVDGVTETIKGLTRDHTSLKENAFCPIGR